MLVEAVLAAAGFAVVVAEQAFGEVAAVEVAAAVVLAAVEHTVDNCNIPVAEEVAVGQEGCLKQKDPSHQSLETPHSHRRLN